MKEKLSRKEQSKLSQWRDRWIAIGLSTEPADRDGARRGAISAFAAAGLEPPQHFVWLRSPREAAVGAYMLTRSDIAAKVFSQIGEKHDDLRLEQIAEAVHQDRKPYQTSRFDQDESPYTQKQVCQDVQTQASREISRLPVRLKVQLREELQLPIEERVFDLVGREVRNEISATMRFANEVRVNLSSSVNFGQHSAGVCGYYDYLWSVLGLECVERLSGVIQVARCAGWWWPMQSSVVFSERPVRLCLDEMGRLHSGDGMAIEYADGWGLYRWHGTEVPEEIILRPHEITPEKILKEWDVELRRIMIEIFGLERFMQESKAVCLDRDQDRELLSIRLGSPWWDDEPLVAIKVRCPSTGRIYVLRVPPDMTNVNEAVAWTFGMGGEEYRPGIET